jgi:RNA polymerase sigma-70 factor (ECF subfamily)
MSQGPPVLAGEAAGKLDDAVQKVPPTYRVPLVLYEMEAWTYEQIAAFCNVRIGTVKSRIWRGRELLRGLLESYWKG